MAEGASAVAAVPEVPPPPFETQLEMEARLRKEFEGKLEVWKMQELADLEERNNEVIQKSVTEWLEKVKKEREPLTKDQIQALLDQEYATFTVKLKVNGELKEFVIEELPQEAERTFYRKFKDALTGKAQDIAALRQADMDMPPEGFEERVQAFLRTFDGAFDLLAEACVLVLNYDGKKPEITKEFLQKNLNSFRMWRIVQAQMEVNKLRDFFSELSLTGAKAQTLTTLPDIQHLQQLLHK